MLYLYLDESGVIFGKVDNRKGEKMVKRIGIMLFFMAAAVGAVREPPLRGLAFAATQENGQPCPPECVTDSMEIITWFPAPYGLYGELNSMKLAIGDIDGNGDVSEGDIPPADGQIYVDRGVIFKPIDQQNVDNDNIDNMIHPAYDFTQKARQGEVVYTTDDKFYHYNGSSWVPQAGGSSSLPVLYTACSWRSDYREGAVGIGAASNWGCTPPACPTTGGTWVDLGVIATEPQALACTGFGSCNWDESVRDQHPVSAGRSVRACLRQ